MKKRVFFGMLIGIVWTLFLVYIGYRYIKRDKTLPEITVAGPLEVSLEQVKGDAMALRQGVTARDDRDGDITDQLLVEKVKKTAEGADNEFCISYGVFDKAGNLGKADRKLIISDYKETMFFCNASLRYAKGMPVDLNGCFGVEDAYDGISEQDIVYELPMDVVMGEAECGLYEGKATYTNQLRDETTLTFFVDIYDTEEELTSNATSLLLKKYVIYADADHPVVPEENLITIKDNGVAYQVDTGKLYQYDSTEQMYREIPENENIHGMKNLVTEAVKEEVTGKWMNYRYVDFYTDADYSKPGTYVGTYTYASDMTGYVAKVNLQIVVR